MIVAKLRRHEYFTLGWAIEPADGSGRVHLSIHADVPIEFHYRRSERPRLNRAWIEALMDGANSARGVMLRYCAGLLSLHPSRP